MRLICATFQTCLHQILTNNKQVDDIHKVRGCYSLTTKQFSQEFHRASPSSLTSDHNGPLNNTKSQ